MSKARRAKGEGSLRYNEKRGFWTAQVTVELPTSEKKRVSVYGKTKEEAAEKMRAFREGVEASNTKASKQTVGEWLTWWLDNEVASNLTRNSQVFYRKMVVHAKPIYGIPLRALKPASIEELYSEMTKDGKSKSAKAGLHRTLSASFNRAVVKDLMPSNPLDKVVTPKPNETELNVWDAQQTIKFLDSTEGDFQHAFYMSAIHMNARFGELLGLHWEEIDFEAKAMRISHTLEEVKGKIYGRKAVKTRSGNRSLVMASDLIAVLKKHRLKTPGEKVFPNQSGGWQWQGNVTDDFKKAVEKAGLPLIRIHDLRHTGVTLALVSGMSPKTVSARAGHSKVGFTLDKYAHFVPAGDANVANALEDALRKARKEQRGGGK